jgi:adenosylcobinamide kinase/adenosylcobinamide-phosphate guanylyltransferase
MVAAEPGALSGLVLVSGPSRSGKSRWAEHIAGSTGRPVLYLATGPSACGSADPAWTERVALHRQRRPPHWQSLEVQGALTEALQNLQQPNHAQREDVVLVDSLGTWLAWHLEQDHEQWRQHCDALIQLLRSHPAPVVVVVEETGWGVVPPTAIGGLFRDRLGSLQQQLMTDCTKAWLVLAGRAINLMELGLPIPQR